jgi:hypothetical protein
MASIEIKNYELEIENERGRGLKRGDGEDAEGVYGLGFSTWCLVLGAWCLVPGAWSGLE